MKYVCRCCKQLKEIEDNLFKKGYEKECPDCRRKHVNKFICPFCGRKMNNRTHLKSCKNNPENNWSEEPQFFEDGKKRESSLPDLRSILQTVEKTGLKRKL